ncbi:phosphotransferase [Nocardia noduli]|uniref:phosphotransferase n=1 Tax=Nocardia noduli TaxID=2815722 RepID=UPI001C24B1F3|nr:aminoglycoside phosphotransferase family protein [Nocardia noduli]
MTDDLAILGDVCAERGVDPEGAQLIHHSSNAVYLLPKANAVARMSTSESGRANVDHIYRVTRWLTAEMSFAATAPLDGCPPVLRDRTVVSFWTYYPQPVESAVLDSVHLAGLLRQLHDLAPPEYIELPIWKPLESLHSTLQDERVHSVIAVQDRAWLLGRIEEIRDQFSHCDWPLGVGLIHGDAWSGNLLWNGGTVPPTPTLGDWDWVSIGPREVDLIPTWHAAIRYGRSRQWVTDFIARYGYDLTDRADYPALLEMRDLVQLSGPLRRATDSPEYADRLHQRLTDIKAGRKTTQWSQYS